MDMEEYWDNMGFILSTGTTLGGAAIGIYLASLGVACPALGIFFITLALYWAVNCHINSERCRNWAELVGGFSG